MAPDGAVWFTELRGNTFYAKIYLGRGEEILAIDARPSDAIALALRTQAPMFVSDELFHSNRREISTQSEDAGDEAAGDGEDDEAAFDDIGEKQGWDERQGRAEHSYAIAQDGRPSGGNPACAKKGEVQSHTGIS